jgi:hypothetical protein
MLDSQPQVRSATTGPTGADSVAPDATEPWRTSHARVQSGESPTRAEGRLYESATHLRHSLSGEWRRFVVSARAASHLSAQDGSDNADEGLIRQPRHTPANHPNDHGARLRLHTGDGVRIIGAFVSALARDCGHRRGARLLTIPVHIPSASPSWPLTSATHVRSR